MDTQLKSYPYEERATQLKVDSLPTPTAPALQPPAQYQLLLGPENTVATCPFCLASIKTAVEYTNNTGTHIAAALCFAFMCCCIPYFSDSARNADHYCPKCKRYLGTYRR